MLDPVPAVLSLTDLQREAARVMPVAARGDAADAGRAVEPPEEAEVQPMLDRGTENPTAALELGAAERSSSSSPQALVDGDARRESILRGTPGQIRVSDNPEAEGGEALHEISWASEVSENDETIEEISATHGVDPDLVRAIMYMETSRGWYDGIASVVPFLENETIRPMNVNAEYWKDLGYTREELEDPRTNIEAGVRILRGIMDRMPNATPRQIATIYNYLPATSVSDYGVRVEEILRQKLWEK
jgi:hypothetical protein